MMLNSVKYSIIIGYHLASVYLESVISLINKYDKNQEIRVWNGIKKLIPGRNKVVTKNMNNTFTKILCSYKNK